MPVNRDEKVSRGGSAPSRRQFLQAGIMGGLAVAALPAYATANDAAPAEGAAAQTKSPKMPAFELEEITLGELQAGMKSGKYTARSLTAAYLARIEAVDKRGPRVNSVIEINPDALAIARELDKEHRVKGPRGPLHGVPVLIKDNIGTADRMKTSAGSLALADSTPARDSFVASRLREAGAVILGKTNLSEWANFRSSHSTSGWSGRGGLTRNPYALDRNACGSSSGSGAATSANFCALAVGSETDGSVVCPSSANGIVGIKPTLGLISRTGIIPIAHSQDTAGPMARTVTDAAILLGALTGVDAEDSASTASSGKALADYTRSLDPKGLQGARIGVVRKYFGFSDAVDALMNARLEMMKKEGAIIVDPAEIETFGKFDDTEFLVLLYEFKADLNKYLATLGPEVTARTLKDLIEFNKQNKEKEMPYFGQDVFEKAEAKGDLTSKEYVDALANNHKLTRTDGIDATMDKFKLDALVAPTAGPAWLTDLANGDHSVGGSSNAAAVAGYPNINVPAGFVFGLPVGISFFGRAWSEPTLIKIAYAFEQMTKVRKPPQFLPALEYKV
jgi:amidase